MELTILQQRMLFHPIDHLLALKLRGNYYRPCQKLGLCLLLGVPGWLNFPEAQTWIRIPTFAATERKMRLLSFTDPGCCIVGLYQEQCCHANSLISPVQKKTEVIRKNAVSSVLQNVVGSDLVRNFSYFLP